MIPQDDNRAFLTHFDNARKSYVSNLFLHAVRKGATSPAGVLASVEHELRRSLGWSRRWPETVARIEAVQRAIAEHRDEALAFAQWALDWEALPQHERDRRKAANGETYRRAYMEQQPPTAKQCAYLEVLGYHGEITSRQHASELIDRLRARKSAQAQRVEGRS